jgi:hypothetical protein
VDSASSPNNRVQSFVSTLNNTGTQARVGFYEPTGSPTDPFTGRYYLNVLDSINLCQNLAGQDGFDRFIAQTNQRSLYAKIFQPTTITNFGDRYSIDVSPATGIAGDTKKKPWLQQSFNMFGFPIGLSQATPQRLWIAWRKESFERIHADKGHWMPGMYEGMWNYVQDADANLTANFFAWWMEMYNTFVENPHTMFLLTGMK